MSRLVAVTGCAGFIGRRVTEQLLARGDYVYGVDAFTYAADPDFPDTMSGYGARFTMIPKDIRSLGRWPDVDAVIHLAAETHVDNSLAEPGAFVGTNVDGTRHLLDMTVAKKQHGMPRFLYVSTDEVYGPVDGYATPDSPLRPSSPYAASKAAGDLLVQAYGRTFGLPYTILRPTNNYGTGQYPEKLIPKAIRNLTLGRPVPIHGDGLAERCWLNVDDCARAILFALDHPELPPVLNIGGNTSATVRDVVAWLQEAIVGPGEDLTDCAQFGYERPGADHRYAVDDSVLRNAGWRPTGHLWRDLEEIVAWERGVFRW